MFSIEYEYDAMNATIIIGLGLMIIILSIALYTYWPR